MIKLHSINRTDFAYEIKKLDIQDSIEFEITNAMAQNIEILLYYMELKKVKNITLHKESEPLDIICYKVLITYMQKYYLRISKIFNIKLEGFLRTELQILLGERFYLNYCAINNIKSEWNENYLKKEKRKIFKNRHLLKYETFKTLIKFQEETPFTYFNFPHEKNADRFVIYFNMHSKEQKTKILNLLEQIETINKTELIKLITENKINDEIFYYAFGFLYKDNKLHRFTLYTKFAENLIIRNKINEFLKTKHNFNIQQNYKNMWYYAIDFYADNHQEIKLYDEPYIFQQPIEDKELQKILHNKKCVRVIKYKNNQLIGEKYEFEFKYFDENNIKRLQELNLYQNNHTILALYIQNNKVVKKVTYEL